MFSFNGARGATTRRGVQKKRRPAGPSPHSQPSWGFPPLFSTSEGRGALDKNLERVSSALCIQPRVFDTRLSNGPYANFALLHVNSRVDKKQRKVNTPTALYSRLLKAGGWPQKALLTRLKFRTVPRDPRWRKTSEESPKRVASEGYFSRLFRMAPGGLQVRRISKSGHKWHG